MLQPSWPRPFRTNLTVIFKNLTTALPDQPPYRNLVTALSHLSIRRRLKKSWNESLRPESVARRRIECARAAAEQALTSDECPGSIFITPHYGDFLTGLAAIGAHCGNTGKRLWIMASKNAEMFATIFAAASKEFAISVIDSNTKDLRELCRRLSAGDCVAIFIDSAWPARSSRMVPFFGQLTVFMTGAAWLSRHTHTPIIPFACDRINDAVDMRFFPAIPLPQTSDRSVDIYLGTALCIHWLERTIKNNPDQWHHWDKYERYIRFEAIYPEVLHAFCMTLEKLTPPASTLGRGLCMENRR